MLYERYSKLAIKTTGWRRLPLSWCLYNFKTYLDNSLKIYLLFLCINFSRYFPAGLWFPVLTINLTVFQNFRSSRLPFVETFYKIGVFKNYAKFTGKDLFCKAVPIERSPTCKCIKKETPAQALLCKYSEIFKNTILIEQLPETVSKILWLVGLKKQSPGGVL